MDPNVKAIINLLINSLGAASGALLAALTAAPDAAEALKSPVIWVGVLVAFFGALRATWNETPGRASETRGPVGVTRRTKSRGW